MPQRQARQQRPPLQACRSNPTGPQPAGRMQKSVNEGQSSWWNLFRSKNRWGPWKGRCTEIEKPANHRACYRWFTCIRPAVWQRAGKAGLSRRALPKPTKFIESAFSADWICASSYIINSTTKKAHTHHADRPPPQQLPLATHTLAAGRTGPALPDRALPARRQDHAGPTRAAPGTPPGQIAGAHRWQPGAGRVRGDCGNGDRALRPGPPGPGPACAFATGCTPPKARPCPRCC